MPQEYPPSVRFRAEELYVEGGLNFDEVAKATRSIVKEVCGEDRAVSVSQLKRWSEEDRQSESEGKGWPEKRDERQGTIRQIERDKLLLMRDLLDVARSTLDPQKVYAFVRLDKKKATGARRPEETAAPEIDRPALFLEDLNFIAKILKEKDPEGLKVLSRSFDLIVQRFKRDQTKNAPTA